ncbi:MAG: PQQ-binding-like beta-propeller repeat protein [Verrucomicrobia bacterium]|nr:PQQ-binding-like beta-propeller repeat protein [Verrucomicrobiota bacterium]
MNPMQKPASRRFTQPPRQFFVVYWVLSAVVNLMGLNLWAHDWPEFRGLTGQGHSPATDVPIRWSATENVAWKAAIPGGGWSSPVLVNGRVYLTSAISAAGVKDLKLTAICLDARDGKLLWSTNVFSPEDGSSLHRKNSYASPTPLVRGGRLYVHFGHLGTACLDLNGQVLWRQTSITYPSMHGNGGSPLLAGDRLIFSCDGITNPAVVALDRHTGKVQWKTPRDNDSVPKKFSFSTPLLITNAGREELISPGAGATYAYDPTTGRPLWKVSTGTGFSVVPRPVFAHGLLFVNTDYDFPKLFAIRPGGEGDVTSTHLAWQTGRGAPSTPSALVVGSELYFVSDAGIATCADAKTGQVHWNERLGGGFSASPVFAAGHIYFQNEEGVGYVLKAGKTFEQIAKNELGERTLASYAVDDGTLFIRSAEHLFRIGKK